MEEQTPNIVIIDKNKKINWLAAALVVVIIMLIFGWCRGYRNGLSATAAIDDLKKLKDSVEKITIRQNEELTHLRNDTADASRFAQEALQIANEIEDSLAKSEVYTKYLADRIKAAYRERDKALGKVDTIDIINNCDDLAEAYVAELEKRTALKKATDSLDAARLQQIETGHKVALHWKGRADTAVKWYNTAIAAANSLRPRVNFKAGVTAVYSPFLAGVGGSLVLEDRKGKLFQASGIVTDKGLLYQGSVLLKLSFRKR